MLSLTHYCYDISATGNMNSSDLIIDLYMSSTQSYPSLVISFLLFTSKCITSYSQKHVCLYIDKCGVLHDESEYTAAEIVKRLR